MAVSGNYRDFVLEQLGRVTSVTGKAMFGGVGINAQGLFFTLIDEDRLYFKVDDATRPDFERLGMEPFRPFGDDSAMGHKSQGCPSRMSTGGCCMGCSQFLPS